LQLHTVLVVLGPGAQMCMSHVVCCGAAPLLRAAPEARVGTTVRCTAEFTANGRDDRRPCVCMRLRSCVCSCLCVFVRPVTCGWVSVRQVGAVMGRVAARLSIFAALSVWAGPCVELL
jgi:hypothetical protein